MKIYWNWKKKKEVTISSFYIKKNFFNNIYKINLIYRELILKKNFFYIFYLFLIIIIYLKYLILKNKYLNYFIYLFKIFNIF